MNRRTDRQTYRPFRDAVTKINSQSLPDFILYNSGGSGEHNGYFLIILFVRYARTGMHWVQGLLWKRVATIWTSVLEKVPSSRRTIWPKDLTRVNNSKSCTWHSGSTCKNCYEPKSTHLAKTKLRGSIEFMKEALSVHFLYCLAVVGAIFVWQKYAVVTLVAC